MMTLTKSDKRDAVSGDCGCFSLLSYDQSIAHRGTIRCLSHGEQAHLLGLVEERVSTFPKANAFRHKDVKCDGRHSVSERIARLWEQARARPAIRPGKPGPRKRHERRRLPWDATSTG